MPDDLKSCATPEELARKLAHKYIPCTWDGNDQRKHGDLCNQATEAIAAALAEKDKAEIYGFYEEKYPIFTQGDEQLCELHELETAKSLNGVVKTFVEKLESAEAKLAEATKYAVKLHMLVSEVQAANLQLVGALERLGGSVAFVMPHVIAKGATGDELKARTEFARATLSATPPAVPDTTPKLRPEEVAREYLVCNCGGDEGRFDGDGHTAECPAAHRTAIEEAIIDERAGNKAAPDTINSLEICLTTLVRLCRMDNVGSVDMDFDPVIDGEPAGTWHIALHEGAVPGTTAIVEAALTKLRNYYRAEMMGDNLPTGARAAPLKAIGEFFAAHDQAQEATAREALKDG